MSDNNKGWIIGFSIGRSFNPFVMLFILGVLFIVVAFILIIRDLSVISSGNVTYVKDTRQWQRAWQTEIVDLHGGVTTVAYAYSVGVMEIDIPGNPPAYMYSLSYDLGDPSQIDVFQHSQDFSGNWMNTNGRVIETRDDSFTLEYDLMEKGIGVLPGKSGDSEEIGRRKDMFYDMNNPSHIARDVKDFLDIMVIPGIQILIGGALILFVLRFKRGVGKAL